MSATLKRRSPGLEQHNQDNAFGADDPFSSGLMPTPVEVARDRQQEQPNTYITRSLPFAAQILVALVHRSRFQDCLIFPVPD